MFFRRTCTIGEDGGDVVVTPPGSPERSVVLHRAMVSFASCMGAKQRHEIYLSAPITTGAVFVNWRKEIRSTTGHNHPEYEARHRKQVIERNIARVAPLAAALRLKFSDRLVIDPTTLDEVDNWSQQDYHEFWCEVINRYAHTVVFADGWELSHGCVREFETAVGSGLELLTENLNPLCVSAGIKMVADAVTHLERLDEDATCLRRSLAKLRHTAEVAEAGGLSSNE
jgi:hypothetical protein